MTRPATHADADRTLPLLRVALALTLLLLVAKLAPAQESTRSFDAIVASASSARDQGDISHAIEFYQQAVQLNPKWPDGWWYLGSLQYGASIYQPAIVALSHYIELTPTAGPAFALRGLCEFETGQYPESLQDIQRAIALGAATQPRNAGIILYHEALLLTRTGNFEEALGKYTVMVKHGNVDQNVIDGIGLAGLRMPVLPKDIDPSQAAMISMVGQAASTYMGGDLQGAATAFQDLFQRFPATSNLHYLYGYLLFTAEPDEAIAQFQDELSVSPASATTHAMLAWAYGLRGDFPASLPNAQKAVAEDPSLAVAQLVLGRALVETGDMNDALPHLEAVLSSDPQNLEAHLALAKAYSKLGRKDDARKERLQCLAISGQGKSTSANM